MFSLNKASVDESGEKVNKHKRFNGWLLMHIEPSTSNRWLRFNASWAPLDNMNPTQHDHGHYETDHLKCKDWSKRIWLWLGYKQWLNKWNPLRTFRRCGACFKNFRNLKQRSSLLYAMLRWWKRRAWSTRYHFTSITITDLQDRKNSWDRAWLLFRKDEN